MAVINIHKEIIEEESQQDTDERDFENDYIDGDECEEDCDQQDGESQINEDGEEEDYELNSEEEELFQRLEEDNQFEQFQVNQNELEEVEELEESKFDRINEDGDITNIQIIENLSYEREKSPYEDNDEQNKNDEEENQQEYLEEDDEEGENEDMTEENEEEPQSLQEVNKRNDEFWAKQAERINSKMNGMMKSMVNQQSKDIFNQQQQMNCFAFYSGHLKQCLSGMSNTSKSNIEKLFYDTKSKEEQHQTNEDPQKLKKKRNLVSNNLEQSYHIRSVVKLFDELNNYQKIYPFVKQVFQNKHIQFKNFTKNKDNIVNQLTAKYCKAQTYPVRKPQKPPLYDENLQIRKQYHYKLRKRVFCLSNKKNAVYEEEPEKEKPTIIQTQSTISKQLDSQRQSKMAENNPSPSVLQNKTIVTSVLAQNGNYNKYSQSMIQKQKVGTTYEPLNEELYQNSLSNHHSPERNQGLSPMQHHFSALHNIGHEFTKEFLNLKPDPIQILQQQRLSGLRIDNKPQEDIFSIRDEIMEINKYYTGSHLIHDSNFGQRGSQKYLENNDSQKKIGTMAKKYQNQYNKFQIFDHNMLRGPTKFDKGFFKQDFHLSKGALDTVGQTRRQVARENNTMTIAGTSTSGTNGRTSNLSQLAQPPRTQQSHLARSQQVQTSQQQQKSNMDSQNKESKLAQIWTEVDQNAELLRQDKQKSFVQHSVIGGGGRETISGGTASTSATSTNLGNNQKQQQQQQQPSIGQQQPIIGQQQIIVTQQHWIIPQDEQQMQQLYQQQQSSTPYRIFCPQKILSSKIRGKPKSSARQGALNSSQTSGLSGQLGTQKPVGSQQQQQDLITHKQGFQQNLESQQQKDDQGESRLKVYNKQSMGTQRQPELQQSILSSDLFVNNQSHYQSDFRNRSLKQDKLIQGETGLDYKQRGLEKREHSAAGLIVIEQNLATRDYSNNHNKRLKNQQQQYQQYNAEWQQKQSKGQQQSDVDGNEGILQKLQQQHKSQESFELQDTRQQPKLTGSTTPLDLRQLRAKAVEQVSGIQSLQHKQSLGEAAEITSKLANTVNANQYSVGSELEQCKLKHRSTIERVLYQTKSPAFLQEKSSSLANQPASSQYNSEQSAQQKQQIELISKHKYVINEQLVQLRTSAFMQLDLQGSSQRSAQRQQLVRPRNQDQPDNRVQTQQQHDFETQQFGKSTAQVFNAPKQKQQYQQRQQHQQFSQSVKQQQLQLRNSQQFQQQSIGLIPANLDYQQQLIGAPGSATNFIPPIGLINSQVGQKPIQNFNIPYQFKIGGKQ
ncbi:UNKNOWN [Stylonychia lemnae]|uniref:Uncharacterized protein n=1 Tax=Stylonychia lemnae TaxID=5949 RepID=A0A078AQW0_STYLE|nr:UNKNOWN [Stylonychia lemnae]|eukprot:CDW84326.1 UNKNOWN [Stylonychia lemnae]